jgi:hypothetical protein
MAKEEELNTGTEEMQALIVTARIDSEARLANLHEQLEAEKARPAEELEHAR